jgi:hypothetical protein
MILDHQSTEVPDARTACLLLRHISHFDFCDATLGRSSVKREIRDVRGDGNDWKHDDDSCCDTPHSESPGNDSWPDALSLPFSAQLAQIETSRLFVGKEESFRQNDESGAYRGNAYAIR